MRGQAILFAGLLAVAYGGQAAAQTIDNSSHDLGGTTTGDNGEICVYCHTPHGARLDIEAPLWNKPDPGSTYVSYDSTTIDGDVLAVGSVSIACLTCHDGTQAMDAVINGPGSGAGTMPGTGDVIGAITGASGFADLGVDLRNDHPIGIQYGTISGDPDFVTPDTFGTGTGQRWWVDTGTPNATRDKTDMILYTRDNSGTTEPFVECASCHDPHAGNDAKPVDFMRISNINSDVCLACHVK